MLIQPVVQESAPRITIDVVVKDIFFGGIPPAVVIKLEGVPSLKTFGKGVSIRWYDLENMFRALAKQGITEADYENDKAASFVNNILEYDFTMEGFRKDQDIGIEAVPGFGAGRKNYKELYRIQKAGAIFLLFRRVASLFDQMGAGKAQPLYSKILTPVGWKLMGEMQVGDNIVGIDGFAYKVTGVYPQGLKKVFELTFTDGSRARCSEEHLWQVITPTQKHESGRYRIKELKEFKDKLHDRDGNTEYFIPVVKPIHFYKRDVSIDPYLLGVLLGDGGIKHQVILSTSDAQIVEAISNILTDGMRLRKIEGKYDYRIVDDRRTGRINSDILPRINSWGSTVLKTESLCPGFLKLKLGLINFGYRLIHRARVLPQRRISSLRTPYSSFKRTWAFWFGFC